MLTRWNKMFHMYQTCSAFVDLLSKEMLAWYERTYKDTPNRFSASQFPFLRRTKATKLSTSNLLLSNGSETPEFDKIFKKADCVVTFLTAACHLAIANLDRVLKKDEISKLNVVFQDSLSPSRKLPVRNVTTKLAILNIWWSARVFNAVEKQMFRSTKLGCFISPQRGKLRCWKQVRNAHICSFIPC